VRILVILLLAVAANVYFRVVLLACGVEAPPWFVLAFDVLLVVPPVRDAALDGPRPSGRPEVTTDA
jgi:hypothetical protein